MNYSKLKKYLNDKQPPDPETIAAILAGLLAIGALVCTLLQVQP